MTTQTWSTVVDQTTDAGFRAWGSEFNTNLAAPGLVQTGDTGQINWTTVTRAAGGTAAGYEIWRLADSSLFFKIEYGSGAGGSNVPGLWITVGTGSNGSGTLTGQLSTRATWSPNASPSSTSTAYPSYVCVTANALSITWKVGGNGAGKALGFLCVGKTVDSTGAITSTGYGVVRMSTSTYSLQTVRTAATAQTFSDTTNFCIFPGTPSASAVGTDLQAYMCWLNTPAVAPFAFACGFVLSEITAFNTFSVAMVGSVSHTYLAIGSVVTGTSPINGQGSSVYGLAVVWE